ncbi:MAG TPA: serine hydrolase domain-containing protein [Acidimicrobiales bacterium]|nr:serine hydrolase domain-containing protein [Acidimicrobiales bacterium]
MSDPGLAASIDRVARETGFSGVVRVDLPGRPPLAAALGWAHRGHGIANTVDTRFGIASGGKGLTALTVMSLVEDSHLGLDTTARSLLGPDLPLIDDAVTVEHLLAHRSGIGDYLPEGDGGDIADHVLPVPVHELADTEQYLPVLDGHPQVTTPGERFAYCNGGYVVLALLAERATGVGFHDLVRRRVCEPAGLGDTAFLRSDEPDRCIALGYLTPDGLRTNVLHLPVRGSGDGGIHSTAADVAALWRALSTGGVVAPATAAEMVRPRSDVPEAKMRYGLGFWLHPQADRVMLEGYDAGVSFRTVHDPADGTTHTVVANTSDGAWPLTRHLDEALWG